MEEERCRQRPILTMKYSSICNSLVCSEEMSALSVNTGFVGSWAFDCLLALGYSIVELCGGE